MYYVRTVSFQMRHHVWTLYNCVTGKICEKGVLCCKVPSLGLTCEHSTGGRGWTGIVPVVANEKDVAIHSNNRNITSKENETSYWKQGLSHQSLSNVAFPTGHAALGGSDQTCGKSPVLMQNTLATSKRVTNHALGMEFKLCSKANFLFSTNPAPMQIRWDCKPKLILSTL